MIKLIFEAILKKFPEKSSIGMRFINYSQDFLSRYKIGTPANSRRVCDALTKKELILKLPGLKGVSYRIYDVFFMHWLKMEFGVR